MIRSVSNSWLLLCGAVSLVALGCETGGVGDPCTPEDEYQTRFSGYSEDEVNVESRSFQCETRVCLVNHFRGRVSCPYGQTEADLSKAGTDGSRCRIPGTSGDQAGDQVAVAVQPQLVTRRDEKAVYCSCRCKNADGSKDDGARYCDCPEGFSCTKLLDDLGLGSAQLAGYYCIRNGSQFKTEDSTGDSCAASTQNCGNEGKNP